MPSGPRRSVAFGRLLVCLSLVMAACGSGGGGYGGGGGGSSTPSTYTVGGTISGLTASGMVLQNNGGDNLSVSASATAFTFATRVASGAPYAVTVLTQPTGQTCGVTGGSGTMAAANVTTVSVGCTPVVAVGNLRNRGVTHSGFVVGTAGGGNGGVAAVEVSLDGGASATGTTAWSFKLPSGGSTWRDSSAHTIAVRVRDGLGNFSPVVTLNVRKGVNQDVNGDGYADVVVGASGADTAYVFQSAGASGIASAAYTTANATLTGPAFSSFGQSVALGDVNGDGYADVVIGAYQANSFAGAAYVFQSAGASGIASAAYTSANATLTGPAGSAFGYSVALMDMPACPLLWATLGGVWRRGREWEAGA